MAAQNEPIEDLVDLSGKYFLDRHAKERALTAGVHHLGERAVGEDDATAGVERGDAVGNGLEHRLKLTAARFKRGVGGRELDGGALDSAAAVLEVRSHVVEASD